MFVFNRFYVTSKNIGFGPGDSVPENLFTKEQTENLLLDGTLKQVFAKAEALAVKPQAIEQEEIEEVLDPIEALDPERKARKKK